MEKIEHWYQVEGVSEKLEQLELLICMYCDRYLNGRSKKPVTISPTHLRSMNSLMNLILTIAQAASEELRTTVDQAFDEISKEKSA